MNEKDCKQIINLLRKQNAILADISKKLDLVCAGGETKELNLPNADMIPVLTANEKTLDICRVVKNGILYTFSYGNCIESRKASNFESYVFRSADDEKKD